MNSPSVFSSAFPGPRRPAALIFLHWLTLLLMLTFWGKPEISEWGWRIAFGIGGIAAVVVFWLRRGMDEVSGRIADLSREIADLAAASTITVPGVIAAIRRFRAKKRTRVGCSPGASSETSTPRSAMPSITSSIMPPSKTRPFQLP